MGTTHIRIDERLKAIIDGHRVGESTTDYLRKVLRDAYRYRLQEVRGANLHATEILYESILKEVDAL